MRKQYLKAAAESFAGISRLESACYHYLYGFEYSYQDVLHNHYYNLLLQQPDQIKHRYITPVVDIALIELRYPVPTADATYAWSSNQRAAAASIAKATWSRNQLSEHINFIIDDIRSNAHSVSCALTNQLYDRSNLY